MTYDNVVDIAADLGFKPHGAMTKVDGSSYRAFRKGNRYIWIGYAYIESQHDGCALHYKDSLRSDVLLRSDIEAFLKEALAA